MSEESKKIVLPPYLLKRLEVFRMVRGTEPSYVVRDKLHGTTTDLDAWQFFLLEVLPGCETFEKLQTVFRDRFDRQITRKEIETFFASLADRQLLDSQTAAQHPLLSRFSRPGFVVEDGKAVPKSFVHAVGGAPEPAAEPPPAEPEDAADAAGAEESPRGEPPLGLEWPDPKIKLRLFDPRPILRRVAPALRPVGNIVYVVPLLLLFSIYAALFKYFDLITLDVGAMNANMTLVGHLVFAWLTVHFISSMSAAVVATNYKVSVQSVGFYPTFGFMPRWCLKMVGSDRLTRRQMMWTHAAPLIARVVMLAVGLFIWLTTRGTHTGLSQVALLTVFTCLVGLTLEAGNPLLKAHAYYILCAYFNEPHLRAKAFAAIWNRLRGNVYQAYDRKVLALYGLCTLAWMIVVTLIIAKAAADYLYGTIHLNGSAVILVAVFLAWMTRLTWRGLRKFNEDFERKLQFDRWRSRSLSLKDAEEGEVAAARASYWKPALLICLLLVLFLPYPYQPAGQFVIFPVQKEDLTTDTPGVIDEVFYDGGEYVKKGTVLARLAHDDYTARYNVLTNQIQQQKEVIANLKTLPKPQAVALARQELNVSTTQERYDWEKVERLRPLYRVGAITYEDLQKSVKEHTVDVEQVLQKKANLELVATGPTADEIAAAEAQLAALQADRDGVQAKLDRTYIRMPFDGDIMTLHLQDRVNSYLKAGQPFATVESTGQVTAQIRIQESDLQFVKIGMPVDARPNSWFFDELQGRVVEIDRNVTDVRGATWVNVIALFDNRDGRLVTGATGEAKIGPVNLPVWQAFTLSIERFFLVDLWSWLP